MFTRGSSRIIRIFIHLRSSLRARKPKNQQHLPLLRHQLQHRQHLKRQRVRKELTLLLLLLLKQHQRNLKVKRLPLMCQPLLHLPLLHQQLLQRRQRAKRLLSLQRLQKLMPSPKHNQLLMQRLQQKLQNRLQSLRLKPSDLTFFVY